MPRGVDIGEAIGRALSGGLGAYSAHQDEQRQTARQAELDRRAQQREEVEIMLRQAGILRDEQRYQQRRKDDAAGVVAETLDPWSDVSDETFSTLEGTPYAGRVQSKTEIPVRRHDPTTGALGEEIAGEDYRVWTPTAAESRSLNDRRIAEERRA